MRSSTEEFQSSEVENENENGGIELRSSAVEASTVHASPIGIGSLARGLRVET